MDAIFDSTPFVVLAKPPEIQIWRTLKLGVHQTAQDYLNALESDNKKIGECANDIVKMPEFTCSINEIHVNLVILSVGDLGLNRNANYYYICKRAQEIGLDRCPAEVGPALRLAYLDQPKGELLIVAMTPIADSGCEPRIFLVGHCFDGYWLIGRPLVCQNYDFRFVFMYPRS